MVSFIFDMRSHRFQCLSSITATGSFELFIENNSRNGGQHYLSEKTFDITYPCNQLFLHITLGGNIVGIQKPFPADFFFL